MEDNNELSDIIEGFLDEETENLEKARFMCKEIGQHIKHTIITNKISIADISRHTSIPINKINKIIGGDVNAKILDIIKITKFLDIELIFNFN